VIYYFSVIKASRFNIVLSL